VRAGGPDTFALDHNATWMEVTMFTSNPLDALAVAHAHGRRLRAEAAATRLRGASPTRRVLAVSLHRAADRLDPGRHRPASVAGSQP
jgi:hypothetical protein